MTDAAGGKFTVIADSVAMKGDQLIITEVKDGLGARLSAGQKAMFEVAYGEGKIAIQTAENAAKFGLEAGTNLFSQSAKLTQIAIRLEAVTGGRAAGQLLRLIGTEGVVGGVIRGVLGVGGALPTFSADAH